MAKQSIIGYLKANLSLDGDFLREYKRLDAAEKESLRQYAAQEMAVLGIEIEAAV